MYFCESSIVALSKSHDDVIRLFLFRVEAMNGRPGHSQDTESAKKAKMLSKKRQFHNINFYNIENLFSNRAHPSIYSICF